MNYWINREKRARKAQQHTSDMETNYSADITLCALRTEYCDDTSVDATIINTPIPITHTPILQFECADTVSSLFAHKNEGRVCLLNFASFTNPGGMFLQGSSAQEESLCHESFLYNVLDRLLFWYKQNRSMTNNGLYQNRALYSPDVRFFHNGETCTADVITCASPNRRHNTDIISDAENYAVMKSRMDFIIKTAITHFPDVLILGAFGCGAFCQNPKEVAEIMNKWLNGERNYKQYIPHTVIAVPDANSENYRIFKEVFAKK